MNQTALEELSKQELIQLVLKQQKEIELLKQKLASLPLKSGFRAKLLFRPSVKREAKKPGQKEGHEGRARPMPEKIR